MRAPALTGAKRSPRRFPPVSRKMQAGVVAQFSHERIHLRNKRGRTKLCCSCLGSFFYLFCFGFFCFSRYSLYFVFSLFPLCRGRTEPRVQALQSVVRLPCEASVPSDRAQLRGHGRNLQVSSLLHRFVHCHCYLLIISTIWINFLSQQAEEQLLCQFFFFFFQTKSQMSSK